MNQFPLAQNGLADEATQLWETAVDFLTTHGLSFAINLVAALAIFLIGRWVAGILVRLAENGMERGRVDETLAKFIGRIVYYVLLVLVILAAIDRLGVDTTSLAAILAAAGLAVGLALKDSLSNFAAGVMLILFKPFSVGDFVEAGGTTGIVEEIGIFNTLMRTPDNIQIIMPNGAISGSKITNYSTKDTRRIDLEVFCGYGDDLRAVRDFLEQLIASDERILDDPEPMIGVDELADSGVKFVVRPWVNRADYLATKWDLTEKIKLGFDERGFNIPYPTQDVHLHQAS